ncbi:MAG: dihydropteroate synthase, partial [Rhodobacterales bacterium]
ARDRLGGSLSIALHSAGQGVQFLRVHDTRETRQALDLFEAIHASPEEG